MKEQYEITFILDEGAQTDKVENILRAEGAELKATQDLGVKQFTYPIKKKTSGNYFAIEFTAERESLRQVETELKAEKTLIRYLIVKALRKPAELPPRIKKTEDKAETAAEKPEEIIIASAEPEKIKEEIESKPVEEKVAEVAEVPEEKSEEKETEAKTSEPAVEEKKEEKPARKPRAKAEKVSAEELDKKLEELVKE